MAPVSSLDAARVIRQQLDAGLLDLSVVNQQLWPVAAVQLLLPASPASINLHQRGTDISVEGTKELEQATRDDVTAASRAIERATPEGTDNNAFLPSEVQAQHLVAMSTRQNGGSVTRAQAAQARAAHGREKAPVAPACTRAKQSLLNHEFSKDKAVGSSSVGPANPSSLASSTCQSRALAGRKRKPSVREEPGNVTHKRSRSVIGAAAAPKDQPQSGNQMGEAPETSLSLAWATEFPTFTEWHLLDDFKTIGTRQGQKPFEELGLILQRIQRIGTPKVQSTFTRSVRV